MRNDRRNVECRFVAGNLWWQVARCGVSEITIHSLRSNWPGARREGGSVSAAILDRLSNEAPGQFQRNPEGGMACSSQGLNSELRLNEAKENRRWTTMDDHAFRFGSVTQRVIGWLRVSRFLAA